MFEGLATHDSQDPAGSFGEDAAGFTSVDRAVDADGPLVLDAAGFTGVDAALDPVGFLAAATEVLAKLPAELWRTGNDGFAGIAAGLDALAVQLDCTRVAVLQEAESRGVVDQCPATSSAAWLLEHSRHLEPGDASRTAKLAHLLGLPKNQIMAAAVAGGTVTTRKAMTVK